VPFAPSYDEIRQNSINDANGRVFGLVCIPLIDSLRNARFPRFSGARAHVERWSADRSTRAFVLAIGASLDDVVSQPRAGHSLLPVHALSETVI
jgi:hypothetical protein